MNGYNTGFVLANAADKLQDEYKKDSERLAFLQRKVLNSEERQIFISKLVEANRLSFWGIDIRKLLDEWKEEEEKRKTEQEKLSELLGNQFWQVYLENLIGMLRSKTCTNVLVVEKLQNDLLLLENGGRITT